MVSIDVVLSLVAHVLTTPGSLSPKNEKTLVRFCATAMAPFLPTPGVSDVLAAVRIVLLSDTESQIFREAARYDPKKHLIRIKNPLHVRNNIPWVLRWIFVPDWDLNRSVRMFLLVLIHEMTHAWQASVASPHFNYTTTTECQMEGHANYVTLQVAINAGLEDDYEFGWTLFDRMKRWKFLAAPFLPVLLPSEDDLYKIEECYRHLPRNWPKTKYHNLKIGHADV